MFEIHDQEVPRSAAWWIVDQLRIVGRADEVTAASAIEHALTENDTGVLLHDDERDAILDILDNAGPDLEPLRISLAQDQQQRAT